MLNISLGVETTPLVTSLENYEKNPNSWVVEQLTNGTCEISSTTVILTPESPALTHYSVGISAFRPQLYFKAQSTREANNIYFIPFSADVWVCLFGLLLVITVTLTFILARETRLPHNTPYDIIARIADQKHDEGIDDWTPEDVGSDLIALREHWEVSEILLVTIGALCQQGSARDPSTSAARTLLLVLFVLAVLMFTAYSASVISLISLLPATQQELRSHSDLPVSTRVLLHNTNFYKHQYKFAGKECARYVEVERGVEEAMQGEAAFVGEKDLTLSTLHGLGVTADRRCALARTFLGIEYQRVFVLRNGSKYRDAFNHNIIRLRQYGLLSRAKTAIFDTHYPCSPKERASISGFISVGLSDTQPALYLLGWGLLTSLAVLFIEYFVYFSVLGLRKVFEKSWKDVDKRVDGILGAFFTRRRLEKPHKLYNANHSASFFQKLAWCFTRGTRQPPYSN